jgi:hypothetical protein
MLNNFERFFMSKARPLKVSPEASGDLPDDEELQALIAKIEDLPFEARYEEQNRFYRYLLGCHLLLPIAPGTDLSQGLSVLALENGHGERALPIFSSEAALKAWLWPEHHEGPLKSDVEPAEYLTLPFDTLCGYALEAGVDYIVMNAAGPYGCEISFHDFSYLAEGLLPAPGASQKSNGRKPGEMLVEKATPMRLACCERLPEVVTSRLLQLFKNYQNLVNRVYLFDIGFNEGPLQPAVAVQVEEGREAEWESELWPNLQAVLCEMLERREVVNVFLLNQADGMEQHVRQVTEPIYTSPV